MIIVLLLKIRRREKHMKKFTQLSLCFLLGISVLQPFVTKAQMETEISQTSTNQCDASINNYSIPPTMFKNTPYTLKFNVTNHSSIAWTKEKGVELVSLVDLPFQWTNLTLQDGEMILPGESKAWEAVVHPTGNEGTYPYLFRLKNFDGEYITDAISGNIEIIGTGPIGSVAIVEGSGYINHRDIHLAVKVEGTAPFQYQIKENSSEWSVPSTLESVIPYTLSEGFGKKTIQVRVIDAKGRATELSAVSITLDDIDPAASFIGVPSMTNQRIIDIKGNANDLSIVFLIMSCQYIKREQIISKYTKLIQIRCLVQI
jgi:hypothetical protein